MGSVYGYIPIIRFKAIEPFSYDFDDIISIHTYIHTERLESPVM